MDHILEHSDIQKYSSPLKNSPVKVWASLGWDKLSQVWNQVM